MLLDLTILSYHKFTEEYDEYTFSRTYDQFTHDIQKKIYDWITIDDGMKSMIKACDIMRAYNIRAKLFVCTSLVGTKGYCTWDELRELSKYHDIENHGQHHEYLDTMNFRQQVDEISRASAEISVEIGKLPRFFVPPYNTFNADTEEICKLAGIILLKDRITIKNNSK